MSTYLYGNPKYMPIDENHPLDPHSPYNKSKMISENLCKYYCEDYKLNIIIKNEDEINTKADLTIKTDDDREKIKVKLNDDPEKIKERISGEPGDKVKACVEESNDNIEDCQTKKLPKDEDSTIKFKLEYEE